MFTHSHQLRVRYRDTDQMGYVYYGNYAYYYEVARSEAIRSLGMPYRQLEEMGVMLPITRMNIKYIAPAYYDEMLTIKSIVPELPKKIFMFHYEIYNEEGKLINVGDNQLIFVDSTTRKMVTAPQVLIDKLVPFF